MNQDNQNTTQASAGQAMQYDPNKLLDNVIQRLNLKNDASLSRLLEVAPPVISKIRHNRLPVGASLLVRIHEVTGLSIKELREILGDNRQKYRVSSVHGKPTRTV